MLYSASYSSSIRLTLRSPPNISYSIPQQYGHICYASSFSFAHTTLSYTAYSCASAYHASYPLVSTIVVVASTTTSYYIASYILPALRQLQLSHHATT
ncbi:hypothetical protein COCSADRAFT_176814 [Bipolaris sorokiniana ND90Pr]|uniref:Uncharacterized protein n=1 Tax=Cochliobolus sativus (strain ND90Pr / ATCC 201652) TaxID=665912 RepID=M2RSA4_COCSN|nr:uncharacterized protein COCSADRAFT_176814 [Bipolaris sorokiniana ND90Pr]EMD58103.1 hypothetical protein COCSADRAFT_176814 [Bipolaris sorokiniana ND90Pr]